MSILSTEHLANSQVTKLNQVQNWKPTQRDLSDQATADGSQRQQQDSTSNVETYVVQKYVENPLLINERKFDLRIYVLVTAYSPLLTVWLYRDGFSRFSQAAYTTSHVRDSSNLGAHLTNVAVQKKNAGADKKSRHAYQRTGGKWDLRRLRQYLSATIGQRRTEVLFQEIEQIIVYSLLAVQKSIIARKPFAAAIHHRVTPASRWVEVPAWWCVSGSSPGSTGPVIQDKHCFELYGYDILIDGDYNPVLIEVNASPSLTANTRADYDMKFAVLDDCLSVLDLENFLTGTERQVGGFDLIWQGGPVRTDQWRAARESQVLRNSTGVDWGAADACTNLLETKLGCYNDREEQMERIAMRHNMDRVS